MTCRPQMQAKPHCINSGGGGCRLVELLIAFTFIHLADRRLLDEDPSVFHFDFPASFFCLLYIRPVLLGDGACFHSELRAKHNGVLYWHFRARLTLSEYADSEVNHAEGRTGCVNSLWLGHS